MSHWERTTSARAMAIVYEQHYKTVGPFSGTAHITVLLDRTDDRSLRHRPLFLLKLRLLWSHSRNGCILTKKVLKLDLWKKDAIRRLWSKKAIDWTTRCWASGMLDWKKLRDIRELRWALALRVPVLTPPQVESSSLVEDIHTNINYDAGEIVTPTPGVKRILSSPCCLPHIAQAILSGEPSIVEAAAALLKAIVTRDPKAMIRLYSTSAFYFALAYPGSNLLSIGQLFTVTLVHQGFHGGEEAAVSASLPLAKRSVLGGLLPESLLYVLKRSGPAAFAAAMVSDSDTPEIIWTHKMRAENLIRQVLQIKV
ncbi:hypothetical protein Ahy_A01g001185 isoform M [Arachis hypogaea]|nr:hypothetical protein Ahy_A01g001185 isoform M [Arachis hypogaea]